MFIFGSLEASSQKVPRPLSGVRLPVFSVQYHPEASPGPQDSHYLFERFVGMMEGAKP